MSYIKKITVILLVAFCCIACDSLEGDTEYMRASSTLAMVEVSGSLSMMKYPVTESAWKMVMSPKPSDDLIKRNEWMDDFKKNGALPVVKVSWYDAIEYCNKLSMRQKLKPVYEINGKSDPEDWGSVAKSDWVKFLSENKDNDGYRLPTESEWVNAAGGSKYSGGDDPKAVAWYKDNSGGKHNVGQLKSNSKGLYDMSGNVEEWCADFDKGTKELKLVTRGGNYTFTAEQLVLGSSAEKNERTSPAGDSYTGFRLVKNTKK